MKTLKETIAQGINHGLNDAEIAVELINKGLVVAMSPVLIGVIRDLMTEKPAPTTQLQYSKTDLDNNKGGGGLEIKIEGCSGDPTDNDPGTAIFVEYCDCSHD